MYNFFRRFKRHKLTKHNTTVHNTMKVAVFAIYTGLVYALQLALSFIPNVELVTFMLSMAALVFTWYYVVGMSLIFCFLEMILAGAGVWELTYIVVWPTLVIVTRLLKKTINKHWWVFIIVDSLFGFLFGSFDTGVNTLVYGSKTAMVYWMAGWLFDAIHGIANGVIAFLLYNPVRNLFDHSLKKFTF